MGDKMVIPGPGEHSEPGDNQRGDGLNWDFLFDFHAMIGELEQTEGIVEVDAQVHDPVPNFTIETIEHGLGVRVPAHVRSFYQVTDGLEFSWSYEDDTGVVAGGGAKLYDFATVFDQWLDSLWVVANDQSDMERDFIWSLRGFDAGPADADRLVVMCVEEDYPTYDLFIHDRSSRDSELLNVSFREYFDCLLASRGTYGWQALLGEDRVDEPPHAAHFRAVTSRFFSAQDLGRWPLDR